MFLLQYSLHIFYHAFKLCVNSIAPTDVTVSDMPGAMASHHIRWMLYQQAMGILRFSIVGREHLSRFASSGRESVTVYTMISVIPIKINTENQKSI
jgi:hypothetical protein